MRNQHAERGFRAAGFTLVELLVTMVILSAVGVIMTTILITTNRAHRETSSRADIQGASRIAMNLLTTEIRQAGADPRTPPVGITAIMAADTNSLRIRADLNADGVIQTTEPSEDVTYAFSAGTGNLTRNPGSGAVSILTQLSDFRFSYLDASAVPLTVMPLSSTDRGRVRSIVVSMTCDDKHTAPFALSTRITLRNQ